MKVVLLALSLVLCVACSGAGRPDPLAAQKSETALAAGDLERARMWAERAIEGYPDDPGARTAMAAVHREVGTRAESNGEAARAADAFVRISVLRRDGGGEVV